MPQETLTALQQNRLEAARERVLGFRNQVADGILQAAGLERYGRKNYSFHLGRIKAWDSTTTNVLEEMGLLAVGGMMTVPALMIGAKDGDMDLAARQDRLRLKFKFYDGDMEAVPFFGLGYERQDHRLVWLYDLWLSTQPDGSPHGLARQGRKIIGFPLSKNLEEPKLQCLGISANGAFGVTLPEGAKMLFDETGWLRTEEELGPLIDFMSRRVNLEHKYLLASERQRLTEALVLLKNKAIAINDWLGNEFSLVEGVPKHLKLEGDIRVEALRLTDPEHPSLNGTIIRIRNIMLPKPDSEFVWTNLVRPKADSHTGTLKIIIYSDGDFNGKVEVGGVEQRGYNTDTLLTKEKLAVILVKIT